MTTTKFKAELSIRANEYLAPSGIYYLVFDNREFNVNNDEDVEYFKKKGFRVVGGESEGSKPVKKSTRKKSNK